VQQEEVYGMAWACKSSMQGNQTSHALAGHASGRQSTGKPSAPRNSAAMRRAQDLPAGSDTDCESWEHAEAAAPAAARGEAIEVELGSPDPGARRGLGRSLALPARARAAPGGLSAGDSW